MEQINYFEQIISSNFGWNFIKGYDQMMTKSFNTKAWNFVDLVRMVERYQKELINLQDYFFMLINFFIQIN